MSCYQQDRNLHTPPEPNTVGGALWVITRGVLKWVLPAASLLLLVGFNIWIIFIDKFKVFDAVYLPVSHVLGDFGAFMATFILVYGSIYLLCFAGFAVSGSDWLSPFESEKKQAWHVLRQTIAQGKLLFAVQYRYLKQQIVQQDDKITFITQQTKDTQQQLADITNFVEAMSDSFLHNLQEFEEDARHLTASDKAKLALFSKRFLLDLDALHTYYTEALLRAQAQRVSMQEQQKQQRR